MPSLMKRCLTFVMCNEKLLLGAFALVLMLISGEEFPPGN